MNHKLREFKKTGDYLLEVILNLALFVKFRFPIWHVFATAKNRTYKKVVYEMACELEVDHYVEIGAGLGDISSRLGNSLLLDNDQRVICAAKIKHPKVQYQNFDFKVDSFESLELDKYRTVCIIAVNVLQPSDLLIFFRKLETYRGRLFIVTDVISSVCPNPNSYPWIPETIENEQYFQIDRKFANDSVRDIIVLKRTSIK